MSLPYGFSTMKPRPLVCCFLHKRCSQSKPSSCDARAAARSSLSAVLDERDHALQSGSARTTLGLNMLYSLSASWRWCELSRSQPYL